MDELIFRTHNACDQLARYSESAASRQLVEVLEELAELNDDLWHSRHPSIIRERIASIKAALDRVAAAECS